VRRTPVSGIALPFVAGLRWLVVDRAPFFCFRRSGWVPVVMERDPDTGTVRRVEGPDAFTTWGEAFREAGRFLRLDGDADE